MSYNRITIHGRLTKDPVLRRTPSDVPVCSFTVAVDRRYSRGEDKQTDFFDCTAWRGLGEMVSKHFHKGKEIIVDGEMNSEHWENENGKSRLSWKLTADTVDFCGSKSENGSQETPTTVDELPTVNNDDPPF